MEIRLLGQLEVMADDGPVALGGGRHRALLAVLAPHPNEVVSSDRLVEALWGPAPPPTAQKSLRISSRGCGRRSTRTTTA